MVILFVGIMIAKVDFVKDLFMEVKYSFFYNINPNLKSFNFIKGCRGNGNNFRTRQGCERRCLND